MLFIALYRFIRRAAGDGLFCLFSFFLLFLFFSYEYIEIHRVLIRELSFQLVARVAALKPDSISFSFFFLLFDGFGVRCGMLPFVGWLRCQG